MAQYDVCIVGLKCFDYLTDKPIPRYLGGIERQLTTLARAMSTCGLRVAFITYDHYEADATNVNGIDVFPSYSPDSGVPLVRFFWPRMFKLRKALADINTTVVLQMGASTETGYVAIGCKAQNRTSRFVFLAASDGDCRRDSPLLTTRRERLMYRYGLRSADKVIVQTSDQAVDLEQSYGLLSEVIRLPNVPPQPVAQPTSKSAVSLHESGRQRVLWIGRLHHAKRPEMLLAAARRIPNLTFDIVGAANAESAYARNLLAEAEAIDNVKVHGKVSNAKLGDIYRNAGVLCCTSEIEGFPTVFLEAWANGLPVVTSVDPDGVVSARQIGRVITNTDDLVNNIEISIYGKEGISWSRNARKFFEQEYSIDACLPPILAALGLSRGHDGQSEN